MGTEIYYEAQGSAVAKADSKWAALLDEGWDREVVLQCASKLTGLSLQVQEPTVPLFVLPCSQRFSREVSLNGYATHAGGIHS